MPFIKFLLRAQPLAFRRTLLVLFAGPVLLVVLAASGLGLSRLSLPRLCWCFECAWSGRGVPLVQQLAG